MRTWHPCIDFLLKESCCKALRIVFGLIPSSNSKRLRLGVFKFIFVVASNKIPRISRIKGTSWWDLSESSKCVWGIAVCGFDGKMNPWFLTLSSLLTVSWSVYHHQYESTICWQSFAIEEIFQEVTVGNFVFSWWAAQVWCQVEHNSRSGLPWRFWPAAWSPLAYHDLSRR